MQPTSTSKIAATPAPKSAFEIIFARHSPNVPAMISNARGKELTTMPVHTRSFSPEVSASFPKPTIEYARAATTAMSPQSTALEAAAAPNRLGRHRATRS